MEEPIYQCLYAESKYSLGSLPVTQGKYSEK